MQFKHPEILYALALLIIPILVHLFQLQRFKKTPFTNVAFLKKIAQQTRKSARLKKWLILLIRMLAYTALIFAFSQPYFSNNKTQKEQHTIIYLDNSLSMKAKGNDGELLKRAIQDLIKNVDFSSKIRLITTTEVFKELDPRNSKNTLLNIGYTANQKDYKNILLQSKQLFNNKINTLNKLILISDFQKINNINIDDFTNVNSTIHAIQLKPASNQNIYIDSIAIKNKTSKQITLKIFIKSTIISPDKKSVSIFSDAILLGKSTVDFSKKIAATINFTIPFSETISGRIVVNDTNLDFDNTFYFNISKPHRTSVLLIGKSNSYFSKIYTSEEFLFKQVSNNQLNQNSIQNQQLIILNELTQISVSLQRQLQRFVSNGGSLVIIPSEKINTNTYQSLFETLKMGSIESSEVKKRKITTINYEHPLFRDVFEKKIQNFQYPTVRLFHKTALRNASKIISLDNGKPFASRQHYNKGSIYWIATPLHEEVSNFTNSPLIVPLFYNFATFSFQPPTLYYSLGRENKITLSTALQKDNVIQLENDLERFIPLQQTLQNNVQLTTLEQPIYNGFYKVLNGNEQIATLAFNYNTRESQLDYYNIKNTFKDVKNIHISNSIKDTFSQLKKETEIHSYFKWLLAATFLFLILEILILKFYKP